MNDLRCQILDLAGSLPSLHNRMKVQMLAEFTGPMSTKIQAVIKTALGYLQRNVHHAMRRTSMNNLSWQEVRPVIRQAVTEAKSPLQGVVADQVTECKTWKVYVDM